jgi:S-adenosylmethionine-diacylglycerol 3-amino-3-carboxypropyl transferase
MHEIDRPIPPDPSVGAYGCTPAGGRPTGGRPASAPTHAVSATSGPQSVHQSSALPIHSEVAHEADFSAIRYGQCWEDADILLEALDVRPGDTCLSIASAGDNTLALLTRAPKRVIALDLSPAQLACLELRVAAHRALTHGELLELMGSAPSARRADLYARCRGQLSADVRAFWDAQPGAIQGGIGGAGKFERYLSLFRRRVLPLVHGRARVARLLQGGAHEEREDFYATRWDTWRWRLLFRVFFSRRVMGHMGRDARFFQYVQGNVADRLLARTRYALTALDPAQNPYIQWILTGRHISALPYALRPEHFETIRANLDRLDWRCQSIEDFLGGASAHSIDRFNLSDIFEYMSPEGYHRVLEQLANAGWSGARLAYWNMLVPRRRPESMADRLLPHVELSNRLYRADKAFFYTAFVVEEVL